MQPKSLSCLALFSLLLTGPLHAQEAPPPAAPTGPRPMESAPAAPQTPPAEAAAATSAAPPSKPPTPPQPGSPPPASQYVYQSWDLPPPGFARQGDARGHLPPPRLQAIEPRRYGKGGAPIAIGIGAAYQFRSDNGYERLGAEKPQTELDIFASYDVWQPLTKLVVAAGASYRRGEDGSEGDLSVIRHALLGEVVARYKWLGWFSPHARLALGWQHMHAELAEDDSSLALEDNADKAIGMVGAGLTVHTPHRAFETHRGRFASLSFGVLFEAGYSVTSAAQFNLRAQSDGEVAQRAVSVGKLDASAGFLRVLAVTRF